MTNNPKFPGSNPTATGTLHGEKGQKFVLLGLAHLAVQLINRSTPDIETFAKNW